MPDTKVSTICQECKTTKLRQKHRLLTWGGLCFSCFNKKRGGLTRGSDGFRLRNVWYLMKNRCQNPSSDAFHLYGGRGVSVCDEWQSLDKFCDWARESGYKPGMTLDRINCNGDYQPINCRWVTPREQGRNRRSTKLSMKIANNLRKEFKESLLSVTAFSKACSNSYGTSYQAIYNVLTGRTWN